MTVRTLVLLRHAKAERPGDDHDVDRRLTTRGEADAYAAGVWLAAGQLVPGLVFCSPAARTRQTWDGVAAALGKSAEGGTPAEVRYESGLYHGGRTEVFDLLRAVPDAVRTVLVVGHNPTVSLVSALLVPDDQYDGEDLGLRTAGIAVHRATGPWSDTEPGSMRRFERHTARS